jgi:hypothetical protein
MKKFFSDINNRMEQKKVEKAAEVKAWKEIHEALVEADNLGDVGAALVAEGWGEHEEACHIKNQAVSDALSDAAGEKIAEGTSLSEDSCHAEDAIEAKALALAKGNTHVRNMHKYMPKPAPTRMGPYI